MGGIYLEFSIWIKSTVYATLAATSAVMSRSVILGKCVEQFVFPLKNFLSSQNDIIYFLNVECSGNSILIGRMYI